MKKILIIGAVTVDITSYVDMMPKSDEEFTAKQERKRISGFGWNCARMCHALNMEYDWIGPVGTGVYAEEIEQEAERFGIDLPIRVNEIHGCTYTVVDKKGNYSTMAVPGCEYTFRKEFGMDIDASQYSCVLIGGMEMNSDGYKDLFGFLQKFAGAVYFVPGEKGVGTPMNLLEEMYALNPMMLLNDEQVRVLTLGEDLEAEMAMKILQVYTEAPVLVMGKDSGSYYYDNEESYTCERVGKRVVDRSGCEEAYAAAFVCARCAGVIIPDAMKFADEVSYDIGLSEDTGFIPAAYERVRTLLANAIMSKH